MNSYLFICSRQSYEISKKNGLIGFHDFTNTLNNILPNIKPNDEIFFYITKEKILDGYAEVTKELYFDETPVYPAGKEKFIRRIGIKIKKADKKIDFRKDVVPYLYLFSKNTKAVYSAYLVMNLIKLNEHDEKFLTKIIS